jgi:putative peptidoglycan lipid II flippase
VLAPGFFARGDMSTPVRVGMATLGINLCLNLALMRPLQHVGPPLATSLASAINATILAILLLRRGFLVPDRATLSRLARMGLAALAMAGLLLVLDRGPFRSLPTHHGLLRIAELGAMIGTGMASYALFLQLLGVLDLRTLPAKLRSRLKRRRGAPAAP